MRFLDPACMMHELAVMNHVGKVIIRKKRPHSSVVV